MERQDVITVLEQFRKAYNHWGQDDFVREVFEDDYFRTSESRQRYLDEKWRQFREAPQLFFFSLDSERGALFLRKLMECHDGPGLEGWNGGSAQ